MDLNKLFDDMSEDLNLTYDNLQNQLFKVPALHSKYLKMYLTQKAQLNKLEKDLDKKYRELYKYYSYDYPHTLTSKEVEFHIISDDKYSVQLRQVKDQKALVDVLDRAVKKASQLTFDAKNLIEYLKYINGV